MSRFQLAFILFAIAMILVCPRYGGDFMGVPIGGILTVLGYAAFVVGVILYASLPDDDESVNSATQLE